MDRERLWREINSYFNVQKENCLKNILKRFLKIIFEKCCWNGFFVVGSGGLLLLPPLSCSRVHVQRRCLLHSYLYIFFLLFLHVFKVGYFFKEIPYLLFSLSLPFSVHRTCCISAPFSLPNWSKAVGRYRSLTCKGLTNLTLPLLRRGRSPLCLGRQIDWWSWFVLVLIGKQWHFDIPSK